MKLPDNINKLTRQVLHCIFKYIIRYFFIKCLRDAAGHTGYRIAISPK